MQILYSYLRYTDRHLDVFFLLLPVILSEIYEKPRRKDWHYVFGCMPSFLCYLCHFFRLLPPFFPFWFYTEKIFLLQKKLGEGWRAPSPPPHPPLQCLRSWCKSKFLDPRVCEFWKKWFQFVDLDMKKKYQAKETNSIRKINMILTSINIII